MSILSIYEGELDLTFIHFEESEALQTYQFPYVFDEYLYTCSFSKTDFYTDITKSVMQMFNLSESNTTVHFTTLLNPTKLNINAPVKYNTLATSILLEHFFVGNQALLYEEFLLSFTPLNYDAIQSNMLANINSYGSIAFTSVKDKILRDSDYLHMMQNVDLKIKEGRLVFTGDRMKTIQVDSVSSYILLYDLVKNPGVFALSVDSQNHVPHQILNPSYQPYLTQLGTLINSPGPTECLFKTELGTQQFINLKENEVFILPFQEGSAAKMLIKSNGRSSEKEVFGGTIGIVIDTRNKQDGIKLDEIGESALRRVLNRI